MLVFMAHKFSEMETSMSPSSVTLSLTSLLFGLLLSTPLVRAETPTLTDDEKKEGFEILFNGVDLTGFQEVQGLPGAFWVEDGVLNGRREGGKAYWLATKKKYADFEVRLQYMLNAKGNSGIFIRVPHFRPRTSNVGMEVQLLEDFGKQGTPSNGETGAIYRVEGATKYNSKPIGEWNDLSIKCEGDRIQITLNGELIHDFDMSKHEQTKNRPREGYLGLSAHTDVVKFKNVRIHVLKPASEQPKQP